MSREWPSFNLVSLEFSNLLWDSDSTTVSEMQAPDGWSLLFGGIADAIKVPVR